jgi:CBS-domain-containing membrane protein
MTSSVVKTQHADAVLRPRPLSKDDTLTAGWTAIKVKDPMSPNVRTCFTSDNLATAAQLMWDDDCGCVPVLNEQARVVGMIYRSRHLLGSFLSGSVDEHNQGFHGDVKAALRLHLG